MEKGEATNMQLIFRTKTIKHLYMYVYFKKKPMLNYLLFIFLTCNINTIPPLFTPNPVMFMFPSPVADKQCFSSSIKSCCVPYFHPTLPSDVPTLKSNRVVKQSLKQPLCNHWLFYFALWFRCRVIMALPSAHPVVL